MKTEDTKRLEMAIWNATNKQGVFGCFEVTIGWFGKDEDWLQIGRASCRERV